MRLLTLILYPTSFQQEKMVTNYNNMVLENSSKYKITVIAIDIPLSDISEKFKEKLFMAISKCPQEKTGGLPANITITVNHQYDIIADISVEDGLINGAECCVKYIQLQQNNEPFTAVIWLMFENSKIRKEQCKKYQYIFFQLYHKPRGFLF